jgi:hypothetical protein
MIHFLFLSFSHLPTFKNHNWIYGVHVGLSYGPHRSNGDFQKCEDGKRIGGGCIAHLIILLQAGLLLFYPKMVVSCYYYLFFLSFFV